MSRAAITGRCYCGAHRIEAARPPQVVTYCHCADCRRASGAPVAAFAAFDVKDVTVTPPLGDNHAGAPGVKRWFCPSCGSPLAAVYDYLPGQIYVAIGLLDQAADLAPQMQAHAASQLPWLCFPNDLPATRGSARKALGDAAT